MNTETIQKLIGEAYQNAKQKGFHDEHYSDKHYIALIITELSEMVEAHRKNKRCELGADGLKRLSKLTADNLFSKEFECNVKDTYEDEIADTIIRTFDLAGLRNITLLSIEDNYKNFVDEIEDISLEKLIEDSLEYLSNLTVTELLYEIVREYLNGNTLKDNLQTILETILLFGRLHKIDLETHIRLKMRYNATRPALHGKKY